MGDDTEGRFGRRILTFSLPQFASDMVNKHYLDTAAYTAPVYQAGTIKSLGDPRTRIVRLWKTASVGKTELQEVMARGLGPHSERQAFWRGCRFGESFSSKGRQLGSSWRLQELVRQFRQAWWRRQEVIATRHLELLRGVLPYPWVPFTTGIEVRSYGPFVVWPQDIKAILEPKPKVPCGPPVDRREYLARLEPDPPDRTAFFHKLEQDSNGRAGARPTATTKDRYQQKGAFEWV